MNDAEMQAASAQTRAATLLVIARINQDPQRAIDIIEELHVPDLPGVIAALVTFLVMSHGHDLAALHAWMMRTMAAVPDSTGSAQGTAPPP